MSDNIKFVIIGSGNIANTYVKAFEKLRGVKISGLVSRSGQKPEALKDNSEIEVAAELKKINSDFDAVIICTPNGLHRKSAVEAANLGKHVLTEKPLEITSEAMDEMISVCRKKNIKLGVAYQRRMSPDNIEMKRIIDGKKLGKIFAADLTIKNYRNDVYYNSAAYRGTHSLDGGGPFIQQASHNIDLYAWFFGKPKRIISDYDTFLHDIEVEDHGVALLRYDNGMIGTIIASTGCKPGFDPKLEIHSELGTVVMENDIITLWAVDGIENPGKSENIKIQSGASSAVVANTYNHEEIIKDFAEAIKKDRDPYITGESARLATDIVLDIYKNKI